MTIRSKLTMTAVVVTVLANSLLLLVALQYVEHVWMNEVQTQVALDLNSARAAYRGHIGVIDAFLRAMALEPALASAVEHDDRPRDPAALGPRASRRRHGFSHRSSIRAARSCAARGTRTAAATISSGNSLIARALERKEPANGTIVLSAEELAVEGRNLAERACVELVATAAARPTADTVRNDGMVVAAAVPVFDARGRLAAVLYAGDLLNRRFEIVDGIRREVFLRTTYEGRDIGTVAISEGDVRIATTFALEDGSRAVGTRLSAAVSDEVLGRGHTWTARAFVINDWYFTAYEPIRDPTGQIVGILSVGLLQAPFLHQWHVITGVLLAIVATAAAAGLAMIFLVINAVLRPIGAVVAMSRKVIAGNLSRAWRSGRGEKWACSAGPSTAWPTRSPSARSNSNGPPASSSDAARNWPRSGGWRPASPTRSTTP